MKKILKKIGLIALCLTLVVLYIVGVRALWSMGGAKKANRRPKNTASEVVTTFEEPTDSETDEPETPSSVMYKHTVSLYYRPSFDDEYIYTFEVLSSLSTEFEVVSDISDGTYSVVDNWNTPNVLYIDQGVNYFEVDDYRYNFQVAALTDVVTPA